MKRLKKIPAFRNEEEERKFWSVHDVADYVDLNAAQAVVFPELKPTSRTISIRLPESLLANIKVIANQADVPYQSMMKMLLAEKVAEVRQRKRKAVSPARSTR